MEQHEAVVQSVSQGQSLSGMIHAGIRSRVIRVSFGSRDPRDLIRSVLSYGRRRVGEIEADVACKGVATWASLKTRTAKDLTLA